MSELDANVIVDGQKAMATVAVTGEVVKDGGTIDATCVVKDSNGKNHLAVKIIKTENEPAETSAINAQVLTSNNELVVATQEQEGTLSASNSEIDFNCLVEKENNEKQLAIKTVELTGTIIKDGGAVDASCIVQTENGSQKAIKTYNLSGGGGGGGSGWKNKPASWPDIRTNAQNKHIYLLADDRYPLGFTVTCTGGYTVNIDGVKYNDYASGAQFSMQKTNWPAGTGYAIDYPTGATKAHIIDIFPQDTSNNITKFKCEGVNNISVEEEGILWEHFCLDADIDLQLHLINSNGYYYNKLTMACTSKNDTLYLSSLEQTFWYSIYTNALEYIPTITTSSNSAIVADRFIQGCKSLPKVIIKDVQFATCNYMFSQCYSLKQIDCNTALKPNQYLFADCRSLEELPEINLVSSSIVTLGSFITYAVSLKDTVLDLRGLTNLRNIQCYGSSQYFMSGFKVLRVSSSSPFTGASPQVNVSYTGMDRDALVTLFNDLPTVTNSQTINITGCTGSENLSAADVAIATGKGWTVTGAPTFDTYYAYTDNEDNTIYTKNAVANAGTFTLQNATSFHQHDTLLTEDNGIFSGFSHAIISGYRFLIINVTHPTTDMELIIRANPGSSYGDLLKTDPDATGILLRCTASSVVAYVASTSGAWNVLAGFNTGISLAANNFTYIKISWNSTTGAYSFAYSNDGIAWTAGNTSSGNLPSPYWGSEITQNIGGNFPYNEIWNGDVDMACSQVTIDGVTKKFGTITGASILYGSNLSPLAVQPRFILSSGNIVINNVTYTRNSSADITQ